MRGKKRAANALKNARALPIGVYYIDWINYIFITQSQLALKAAAAPLPSALIKLTVKQKRRKNRWKSIMETKRNATIVFI